MERIPLRHISIESLTSHFTGWRRSPSDTFRNRIKKSLHLASLIVFQSAFPLFLGPAKEALCPSHLFEGAENIVTWSLLEMGGQGANVDLCQILVCLLVFPEVHIPTIKSYLLCFAWGFILEDLSALASISNIRPFSFPPNTFSPNDSLMIF